MFSRRIYRSLLGGLVLIVAVSGCSAISPATDAPASPSAVVAQPSAVPQPTAGAAASNAAVAQPTTVPVGSSAPVTQPDTNAATAPLQTVLNYYTAINEQRYAEAYAYWTNDGAASGQTSGEFVDGFANTVRASVLAGRIDTSDARNVTVGVTILAVVDDPSSTSGQSIQSFGGSYTVVPAPAGQSTPTGWQLSSAAISPVAGETALPVAYNDPSALVQAYYDAINQRDLGRAYTDWEGLGQASGQRFAEFAAGYADTQQVAIELGTPQGDAGAGNLRSTVPIVIVATDNNGVSQSFCGSYQLHRSNLEPWNGLGWRIERAQIAPHEPMEIGTEQSRQLLSGGCE